MRFKLSNQDLSISRYGDYSARAIKRRTYVAHAALALEVGAEVFAPDDLEQPCGTVLQVAANPAGGWDALVALQIAAAQAGALQVGAGEGVALTLGALPYALLEDL